MELFDQEGLAAVFGNGLSTACVVNIGAQVTSLICIEVNEIMVNVCLVFCIKLVSNHYHSYFTIIVFFFLILYINTHNLQLKNMKFVIGDITTVISNNKSLFLVKQL